MVVSDAESRDEGMTMTLFVKHDLPSDVSDNDPALHLDHWHLSPTDMKEHKH